MSESGVFTTGGAILSALVDLVVPADDFASASESGALTFLERMLADRPDWTDRLSALIDLGPAAAIGSEHWSWFAQLVSGGYYADPGNGGNDHATSWRMIDWRRDPAGGWPVETPVAEAPRRVVLPSGLEERYDAIVIGSGAGGGVAACGLAEAGRRVLVVEAGAWPSIAELSTDQIRNPRSDWGVAPLSGPSADNPRVLAEGRTRLTVRSFDGGFGNNASTAGGGTRVYGAQAWRFSPIDFRMAFTYGVPANSALADWPIGYDDLEPFYSRAEWEIGVSGATAARHDGARSRPYPMAPLPAAGQRDRLQLAADSLGWSTVAVPLLINSAPYLGRHACAQCSMCVGFACPIDAKNGSQNTMLTRAFATGWCSIVLETRASQLRTDARGRVIGVTLVGHGVGGPWSVDVDAAEVVVAAGAVESARLLLNSRSDREPNGIGNNGDQVGRHLQGHVYGGATALFDEVVEELIGPGPSIATTDFRHGNVGRGGGGIGGGDLIGGGMIANEFVALPPNIYRYLLSAGFIPESGLDSKQGMRRLARRMIRLMGPIQEVTSASSRVRVDPSVRDRCGVPVAVLSGSVHNEDRRARDFLSDRAAEWLRAAGASEVMVSGGRRGRAAGAGQNTGEGGGPSGGQHQAGTCRMGSDPASSVVDPFGRVWGHDNLRIADSSVHVTNGGVNPVLTIFATAMRTVEDMAGGWVSVVGSPAELENDDK